MEHRIHFTRREQPNTLQSTLACSSFDKRSVAVPFLCRAFVFQNTVSARTIETVGLAVDDSSSTLAISERLVYPLLRLESLAVGNAVLNKFEIVVWGSPVIPPDVVANLDEDKLYHLGNQPATAIEAIIECRGVLGPDFLRNFTVSLDLVGETLVLEG